MGKNYPSVYKIEILRYRTALALNCSGRTCKVRYFLILMTNTDCSGPEKRFSGRQSRLSDWPMLFGVVLHFSDASSTELSFAYNSIKS